MALKFGTSGVRGLVRDLTPYHVQNYLIAFTERAKKNYQFDRVAIGYDLRESSTGIAEFCRAALSHMNYQVLDCGVLPTPALCLYGLEHKIPCIMITGSHIPADRNGLKFYLPSGEILKSDEEWIQSRYEELCRLQPASESNPDTHHLQQASQSYIARYVNFFAPYKSIYKDQTIIFYEHSSAGRDQLLQIFTQLGFKVVSMERSSIFVPVDTESPAAKSQAELWLQQMAAKSTQPPIGLISTDGDADRPLLCDELGRQIRGDLIGLITADFLDIKSIATPISSTTALEKLNSFQIMRTKIGSPYVIEALTKLPHPKCGFEANGGFILGSEIKNNQGVELKALPTRDAVLPILATITKALAARLKLSDLIASLPQRFCESDLIPNFDPLKSQSLLSKLKATPHLINNFLEEKIGHSLKIVSTDEMDGLRLILSNEEILHFRPSGNAPEFRIYIESENLKRSQELMINTKNWIQSLGNQIDSSLME